MENNKRAGTKPTKAPEEMEVTKTEAPSKEGAVKVLEEKTEFVPKKAPVKKRTAPKKTTAKKTEPDVSFYIEYSGKQIAAGEVLEAVKKDYLAKHEGVTVKNVEVYVKPEENTAYYAVNGEGSDEYKVLL